MSVAAKSFVLCVHVCQSIECHSLTCNMQCPQLSWRHSRCNWYFFLIGYLTTSLLYIYYYPTLYALMLY